MKWEDNKKRKGKSKHIRTEKKKGREEGWHKVKLYYGDGEKEEANKVVRIKERRDKDEENREREGEDEKEARTSDVR